MNWKKCSRNGRRIARTDDDDDNEVSESHNGVYPVTIYFIMNYKLLILTMSKIFFLKFLL